MIFKFLRSIKSLYSSNQGAALLEFALVLPIFIYLLFVVIEVGRILWGQNTMNFAVAQAARYAIVTSKVTASQVQNYAASYASQLHPIPTFTVTLNSATDITVQGSYTYTFLVLPIKPITLSSISHYKM